MKRACRDCNKRFTLPEVAQQNDDLERCSQCQLKHSEKGGYKIEELNEILGSLSTYQIRTKELLEEPAGIARPGAEYAFLSSSVGAMELALQLLASFLNYKEGWMSK
jgi:hypothetical protein